LAGPLLGIFIGAYLTRRGQRRQWVTDNRVAEWRELLITLAKSMTVTKQANVEPEDQKLKFERLQINYKARTQAADVLLSRIFIAKEIKELNLANRWITLLQEFEVHKDAGRFGAGFAELTKAIHDKAAKNIKNI
jgi:hypothetical protein